MGLNVYLSEFFWHTLIEHSCCCCLEELEVWFHIKSGVLDISFSAEAGKTSNNELRKIHFLQMQYKTYTKVL